jgi:DNA-binding FrmR family transcriptional regulator
MAIMRKQAKVTSLKRIEGQVRGSAGMVEDEVLRDHVGHCVEGAIASGNRGQQRRKIAELMNVFGRADR